MNFNELRTFIVKRKIKRLQTNYRPVVIKALIENNNSLERKKLIKIIQENNVPIGIVMVLATNKWKILGLCKITEHPSKRHFVFESYGISDEESTRLKEETFEEYDKYTVSSDLKKIPILDWRQFSTDIDPHETRFQKITENPPSLEKNLLG
ncbi:MAG: hypothetical protein OEM28_01560 [Nitrosopumilus sp.]|nr:hypothetical protein [Nitrosopumilus sp.]MDH3486554.1 hypothetical protein [Nitrosopumilus sp.]